MAKLETCLTCGTPKKLDKYQDSSCPKCFSELFVGFFKGAIEFTRRRLLREMKADYSD
jgi:hypothetical protein